MVFRAEVWMTAGVGVGVGVGQECPPPSGSGIPHRMFGMWAVNVMG